MSSRSSRTAIAHWVLLAAVLILAAVAFADWYIARPVEDYRQATYVGRQTCAQCHESEVRQWQGSHHDHAMQLATEETVLGNFDDVTHERLGVATRFFRRDGKFVVNTEGRDGEYRDFQIKYTFGIEPLQQYMVEFDDGRVQVLSVAWDTEQQQWFHVPPPDAPDERMPPGDPMHWTGLAGNWNTMCAECHSTNLAKNYHLASDTFDTTWSEIDVSCESCHGPGSLHVELANSRSLFWDRNVGYGLARLKSKDPTTELEACATCHSRRAITQPGFRPGEHFHDYHELTHLQQELYFADGQIQDEVYVYGSFLQSRMHREGVRCSDCHNPHSLELKFNGNRLCTQCHTPGKYDTPVHHHHPADSAGAQCIECHMPARTYMVVDPRRDHSFRIPRPDLSVELGTPNACNGCHTAPAETPEWAAARIRQWYGERRSDDPHWAPAIAAGRAGESNAAEKLAAVLSRQHTPAIVKATAIDLLSTLPAADNLIGSAATRELLGPFLGDSDPLVRTAAVRGIQVNEPKQLQRTLLPYIDDPSRPVRTAAALRLLDVPDSWLAPSDSRSLRRALDEYRATQEVYLERAGTHMNLGHLARGLGNPRLAAEEFRHAIRLEPYLTGPRTELAALLDANGGGGDQVAQLRREELANLERDARLLPDSAITHYRLGLMRYLAGDLAGAQQSLTQATKRAPNSYEFLMALALLYERTEDWDDAVATLEKMRKLRPADPRTRQILQRLNHLRDARN